MFKFPKTTHMPGSKAHDNEDVFGNSTYSGEVVSTEKLDGSNIMMNKDGVFTRSGKPAKEEWADKMNKIFYTIGYKIPDNLILCGEFIYWRKCIDYSERGFVYPYHIFAVIENDTVFSWDDTKYIAEELSLPIVPELSIGDFDNVLNVSKSKMNESTEGFVIRPTGRFNLSEYGSMVTKFVGSHHKPVRGNNGTNNIIGW